MDAYSTLEAVFKKLNDLEHLRAISSWDEAVIMPLGGASARTQALSTLQTITHSLLTDPKNADLLHSAKDQNLTPWQRKNLEWMEKFYNNANCLPVDLVKAIAENRLETEQAWRKYRVENNWAAFLPLLEENFKLTQEAATLRAEKFSQEPYDILLDDFTPGATQAMIDPIFEILTTRLPSLLDSIVEKQRQIKILPLTGIFPVEKQKSLGLRIMQALGFDFTHGRLDESHHPFCGGVPEDVRITTRYKSDEFISALMGICHETGHARYEQQLPKEWLSQPVGRVHSMACHESQSLLLEMQICRSKEFMHFLSPLVIEHFGFQKGFEPDNLYALYTQVKPSLIRVDADEVTYPLHIILRYEIEKSLFKNKIRIKDLPEAWDFYMKKFLNLPTGQNYCDGVLQDVHWAAGLYGYFPAYTLGSLAAAQFFSATKKAHPPILENIQSGNFDILFEWLKNQIHCFASYKNFQEILIAATGSSLDASFFLDHIKTKYLYIS